MSQNVIALEHARRQGRSTPWQPPSLPCELSDWLERETTHWPSDLTVRKSVAEALPAIIARFRDGLEPHQPDAFEHAMLELSVVFPNSKASDAELRARLTAYAAALEDVPSDLLLKAARLAVRSCEFFPKPAELRKFIEQDMFDRRCKLHRAMMLARRPIASKDLGNPKVVQQVGAVVAALAGQWRSETAE